MVRNNGTLRNSFGDLNHGWNHHYRNEGRGESGRKELDEDFESKLRQKRQLTVLNFGMYCTVMYCRIPLLSVRAVTWTVCVELLRVTVLMWWKFRGDNICSSVGMHLCLVPLAFLLCVALKI